MSYIILQSWRSIGMNKEVVYIGGDSFTEGFDLMDEIMPFNKTYSSNEVRHLFTEGNALYEQQKEWYALKKEFVESKNYVDLIKLPLKNRWSTKLDNILNDYDVLNVSSLGGSGNRAIMYRAVIDILNLIKSGRKINKVILQLSQYPRFMHFYEDDIGGDKLPQRDYNIFNTVVMNYSEDMQDILMRENFISGSVYSDLWDIYTAEKTIENLCGLRPIYVDSVWDFYDQTNRNRYISECNTFPPPPAIFQSYDFMNPCKTNKVTVFFKELSEKIREQLLRCSMTQCIIDDDEKVWTGTFHLTKTVHERFAHLVAKTYFND